MTNLADCRTGRARSADLHPTSIEGRPWHSHFQQQHATPCDYLLDYAPFNTNGASVSNQGHGGHGFDVGSALTSAEDTGAVQVLQGTATGPEILVIAGDPAVNEFIGGESVANVHVHWQTLVDYYRSHRTGWHHIVSFGPGVAHNLPVDFPNRLATGANVMTKHPSTIPSPPSEELSEDEIDTNPTIPPFGEYERLERKMQELVANMTIEVCTHFDQKLSGVLDAVTELRRVTDEQDVRSIHRVEKLEARVENLQRDVRTMIGG